MKVDFYLLSSTKHHDTLFFACRLLEKAYTNKHKVFVYCNNRQDAEALDELLWTFKEDSFIPHNLQGEGLKPPPPVQIGSQPPEATYNDILLNLSDHVPEFHNQFKRILELVSADEAAKAISRKHFQEYRHKQYHVNTHQYDPFKC